MISTMVTDLHYFIKPFSENPQSGRDFKNDNCIIQYVNYTRFCIICQIKMQKRVVFHYGNRFSHFCQGHFSNLAQRARLRKRQRYQLTSLIVHDFSKCTKLKCQKNENMPQFLEMLTQRAARCQID